LRRQDLDVPVQGLGTRPIRRSRDSARSLLLAAAVAAFGVVALFAINLGAMRVAPERYRAVVAEAVRNGTMTETLRQQFARTREIYLTGSTDCLILAMLIMPRDTPVRASVSPREPAISDQMLTDAAPGYGPDVFCRLLARTMAAQAGASAPLQVENHHRYLHAPMTLAALMLAIVPLASAQLLLLLACFAAVAVLGIAAAVRMHSVEPAEHRRAFAFLATAFVLVAFYGLPVFGRAFSHAATDIAITLFLLVALLRPLCQMPERRFVLVVSAFGTTIALLELLTGGIPMGLAALIMAIALGGADDGDLLVRRLLLGVGCFCVAVVTCFAVKLIAVAVLWGPGDVGAFIDRLQLRIAGRGDTWPGIEQWAARLGFDAGMLEGSVLPRIVLAGAMVTYSAFVLAYGSHILGAAFVILPVPILMLLTYVALRRVARDQWTLQPQPYLLLASLMPFVWYAAFAGHTASHSFFMVRPLALNVALAVIAAVMLPPRRETALAQAEADDPLLNRSAERT
jgi:hypothetical protein